MAKIRLGQPVHSTDGLFGEVGDIVIDPHQRTVTHLVVEPHQKHQQARLVPMWLITMDGDVATVELDDAHLRQLQLVAVQDFIRLGEGVDVDDAWDIGTEDVVGMPYWDSELAFGMTLEDGLINVSYDKIPKGECEIRRQSTVVSSDDHSLGHVEGFLADGEHLVAVVVRSGLPGLRHNTVVPMSRVAEVASDQIVLSIDKAAFSKLPKAEGLEGPMGESNRDALEHRAEAVAARLRGGLRGISERAKDTVDRNRA